MTEELKMSLGLRVDGSVVHISELDAAAHRGLACRCTCSECGDRLVAKLGDVRQHHFAHDSVRACTGGDESALHRFAKEVFQSEVQFKVPKAKAPKGNESVIISPALYIPYNEAVLERGLNDIIPDITLMRDGKPPVLVEILVTHEVDKVKLAKLEIIGFPCIEIDLSKTYQRLSIGGFDREGVKQLLIHGEGAEKKWVCLPEMLKEKARAIQEQYRLDEETRLEQVRLAQERQRLAGERLREKERQAQERQRLLEDMRGRQRQTRLDTLLSVDRLKAEAQRKEEKLAKDPMWHRNSRTLGLELNNIPYYLNVELEGEYLFTCHRAVWQSTLFDSWIFKKADAGRSRSILVKYAEETLKKAHMLEMDLYWAHRDRSGVASVAQVVGNYFSRLEECGFVRTVERGKHPRYWAFECLLSRVVALPPEFNNPRFRPLADGILNTETGEFHESTDAR